MTGGTTVQGTAISQQPAASLGARLLPGGLTAGDFTAPTSPPVASRLHTTDGNRIGTAIDMPPTCWDSGTCHGGSQSFLSRTFTATNMGIGAPNGPNPGASTVSSVFVDIVGGGSSATNPAQDLTSTRLDCHPGRTARRAT